MTDEVWPDHVTITPADLYGKPCRDRQHWDFTMRPIQRLGETTWWCQVCWKRLPDGWQPTGPLPDNMTRNSAQDL